MSRQCPQHHPPPPLHVALSPAPVSPPLGILQSLYPPLDLLLPPLRCTSTPTHASTMAYTCMHPWECPRVGSSGTWSLCPKTNDIWQSELQNSEAQGRRGERGSSPNSRDPTIILWACFPLSPKTKASNCLPGLLAPLLTCLSAPSIQPPWALPNVQAFLKKSQ